MLFTHCNHAQILAYPSTGSIRKGWKSIAEDDSHKVSSGSEFIYAVSRGYGRRAYAMAIMRQTNEAVHFLGKSWFVVSVPKCQNIEFHGACDNPLALRTWRPT